MNTQPKHFAILAAQLQTASDDEIVVNLMTASRLSLIMAWGFVALLLLGLPISLQAGEPSFFWMGCFAAAGFVSLIIFPARSIQLAFDLRSRQMTYVADYWVHRPRRVEAQYPLAQLMYVGLKPVRFGKSRTAEVIMTDGTRLWLGFGRRHDQALIFVERLNALGEIQAAPLLNLPQIAFSETRAAMYGQLRSWGIGLLVLGFLQMIAARGFSPWGALLIMIGAASFYLREPPMFMVYTVTIAWAGLMNGLRADGLWRAFALLQAYWAFQTFRRFLRFRRMEAPAATAGDAVWQAEPGQKPARPERLCPWLALILGGASLAGLALVFGAHFSTAWSFTPAA